MKELKSNIPEDCRHCVNDKVCHTYYASNVCQGKWKKVEETEGKEERGYRRIAPIQEQRVDGEYT